MTALSVVMPAYNVSRYVSEAIESILNQTFSDFEFIIVESGSTDGTADVIRDYARRDTRLRPIFFPERRGRGECANVAIDAARAPLIARMDADDVALPERFARQLEWMRGRQIDICGTQAEEFGDRVGRMTFPATHDGIVSELCFRIAVFQPTTIVHARVLKKERYRDATFEDYELWTRLAPRYRMANMPEPLLRHRAHPTQCHVLEWPGCFADVTRYRFEHVYRYFPGTPLADYLALARMSDRLPLRSLPELDRAGRWLVTLSAPDDWWLRVRMLKRWHDTCDASLDLGDGVAEIRERQAAPLQALVAAAADRLPRS